MQGAAAAAERSSRASPDKADESSKKARLDLPDGHMKQEAAGGGDGGAIVGAAYIQRVELAVRMDKQVLHCPLCTLPFKPPVFQCKAGHLACSSCVALLPFRQCKACVDGGGFFDPCPTLDTLVSSTRIGCPIVGCQWYVTYHEVTEHQKYGKVSKLQLSVSTMRLVLLGDDNCVFLMTMGALGAGVTAVSVVCARARAATRPRFTCKMWVNLETPPAAVANCGKEDMVLVDMHMRSSSPPGAVVAVGEPTFLTVPPMYLVPVAGDGASMEVPLHIRIDKLSPWSDALV
ncbi:hypothetical protein VPH35_049286 [Triticum aestivum]